MRRSLSPGLLLFVSLLPLLILAFIFVKSPVQETERIQVRIAAQKVPPPRTLPALENEAALPPPAKEVRASLAAIIIDDLGYNLEPVQIICAFKRPVTVSILPFAPATLETARLAREGGLEIMLHLPLEALHQKMEKASQGTIYTSMTAEEIRKNVLASLAEVPGCRGVNNHTGSMVTEDDRMMPVILGVLKEKNLFFIDSRTSPNSIAFETARSMGVPSAARRTFLDDNLEEAAIKRQLEELFRVARANGRAVGIGHARKETLQALGKYLGLADAYGVKLVFASVVVE
ncbi:MAG: divergent polysaccharide deacetylase family protein [Candidatus Aminicenantes bacterium]|nr:divergent polysaccharide deacetylase family protein [Candidatus Aminicenantes bacterium]